MSSTNAKEHIYPSETKNGDSVAMAVSVHWATPLAIKRYQAWLKANGLTDKRVGKGTILELNSFQNNAKLQEFVKEVMKEEAAPKSRRYMDVVKDTRKRG